MSSSAFLRLAAANTSRSLAAAGAAGSASAPATSAAKAICSSRRREKSEIVVMVPCPVCLADSVTEDHHVGRLDHRRHLVADLEVEVLGAVDEDRRGDGVAAADIDGDLGHHGALLDLRDGAGEPIACADLHRGSPSSQGVASSWSSSAS